jgi:adenylate cyclase
VFSSVDGIGAIPGTPPERRAYIDLPLDPDGVVRRDLLHVRGQAAQVVSLPMRLLEVASGNDSLRRRIERGEASIARLEEASGGYTGLDNAGVQRMLPFHRPGSFPTWSLQQLLSGAVPAERLKGRIVLIGSLAPSLRDGFRVPFSRFRRDEGPGEMPGVEIHAHRLAALLELEQGRGLGLVAAPGWVNGLLLAAGVGAGVAVGERIRSLRQSLVVAGALTLLYLLACGVALGRGRWFDATLPLAGFGAMAAAAWTRRGAEEQRQGKQLQRLLGQTTSSAMAHELVRRSQGLLDGGHFPGRRAEVTVLFADIEHFTSVAERLEPEVLLAWLNRGMALMVAAVHHHGGLVNKFTGDGLLAVFGAPLSQGAASDATAAVRAAGGMRQALRTLNSELEQQGLPPIHLRLGLDSGWVIAGSVGSEERWEFGVIGDAVNCAARIESFDKTPIDDHCRVMMSDTTRHLVGDGVQGVWKPWGRAVLAGRSAALDIWELLDGAGPATSGKASQCTDSRAGS